MLVSFSVENYRSFAGKQTISLVAGPSAKKSEHFSFPTSNNYAPHLLHSACVFGANGAGKSSLIKAMDFFRDFVASSAKDMQEGEDIEVYPNLLVGDYLDDPSEFEIIFIFEDVLYQYGFSADKIRVWEEWLYSRPNTENSRMRRLFYRAYDEEAGEYRWDINNTYVKGEKEVWKRSTRANSLFLSQAVQLNAHDLKAPFHWIQKYLRVVENPRFTHTFTAKQCLEAGLKDKVLSLLRSVDIRITDFEVEAKEISSSDLFSEASEFIKESILEKIRSSKGRAFNVKTLHKKQDGKLVSFDLKSDESDGTNVLFGLAGPWFDVLENGYTLVVDELHNSLHPHALKILVNLFHNPEINQKNAQLIFTSHETSVMNKGFMHQDQVWLAEKSDDESTELIPLSDYKLRDIVNFQKAYLDGRYGGVPKIRDFIDVG